MQSNNRNNINEQYIMQFTRLALTSGDNLFTSDGDYWLQQRRMMQPMFHRKQIAHFDEVINRETSKLLARWATNYMHPPSSAYTCSARRSAALSRP